MKNYQLPVVFVSAFFTFAISACNTGVNLSVPPASGGVESSPIVIEDPTPTPSPTSTPISTPTPSPTPIPTAKNRIFVSHAQVMPAYEQSVCYFNYLCNREAKRAKVPGNFVAFLASSDAPFAKKYKVNGTIYQKFLGVESIVADSYDDLIAGKNDSIFTFANQFSINTATKNYVWTGQKDFSQAASPDQNCKDWSDVDGESIVGLAGTTGSDALATRVRACNKIARLYCIEINN